jgi:DNA oxidative demethylase
MTMRGVSERPEGLNVALNVISERDEADVVASLQEFTLAPMMIRGVASKRLVRHFGVAYDAVSRQISDAPAAPDPVRDAADAAVRSLGRNPADFTEILVTRYPPGAGIGEHRDAPAFGVVAGLSLLSPCTMRFTVGSGTERRVWEQLLPPRSAYLLSGPARTIWRHRIDPVRWERWSITARTIRGGFSG